MTFLDLARRRRSVRAFKPDPVPDDLLGQVLDAARAAPSARNQQPWAFVVVRDPARRAALRAAYDRDWFHQAPVVIAACVDTTACWRRRHDGKSSSDLDIAIAVDHLTLAAADVGLGTCWVCAFDPVAARGCLRLPAHVEPVVLIPLGWPLEPTGTGERKPLAAIVHCEEWDGPTWPPER